MLLFTDDKNSVPYGTLFLLYRKLLRNSYKAKKPSGGCVLVTLQNLWYYVTVLCYFGRIVRFPRYRDRMTQKRILNESVLCAGSQDLSMMRRIGEIQSRR